MESRIELIRSLILVEAAIAVVMALESLAALAFTGPAATPVIVAAAIAALITLWVLRGVRRKSRAARRTAVLLQAGILFFAAADMLLAVLLAQRGLELVPLLTRVVLPIAIIVQLRRADVRTDFGIKLSRRQRRRLAEVAS